MTHFRAYYTIKLVAACVAGNIAGILIGFAIWEYVH